MKELLKILTAVCAAEIIFDLLMPDCAMKKPLTTVCGMVTMCAVAKLILSIFGEVT